MMIENSSDKGYNNNEAKTQDELDENERMKAEKLSSSSNKAIATSRQWTSLRNPRIVRVSRLLGGKDRHSKVCTIRGLRDRRIRLSVPTAIQLYDLQDRLGLSQPSKVVDWLIEVTQSDIDKLPPLQNVPQCFSTHQQPGFSLGTGFYDHNQIKGKEAEIISSQKGNYYTNYPSYNPYNNLDYPSSTLSLSQFGSNNHHGNLFGSSAMQFSFCSSSNSVMPASLFSSNILQHATSMDQSSDVQRQFFNSSSTSNSFIPTLHLPMNSPYRRLPMPFITSKVLDSDHNNTRNG